MYELAMRAYRHGLRVFWDSCTHTQASSPPQTRDEGSLRRGQPPPDIRARIRSRPPPSGPGGPDTAKLFLRLCAAGPAY